VFLFLHFSCRRGHPCSQTGKLSVILAALILELILFRLPRSRLPSIDLLVNCPWHRIQSYFGPLDRTEDVNYCKLGSPPDATALTLPSDLQASVHRDPERVPNPNLRVGDVFNCNRPHVFSHGWQYVAVQFQLKRQQAFQST
jgi:hypothetical protein